jgi:hypothetical protein
MKNLQLIFVIFLLFNSILSHSFAQNDPYADKFRTTPTYEFTEIMKRSANILQDAQSEVKSIVSSEDISRGIDNSVYFTSPDSPIRIRKIFSPTNKTNYLLGDPIGVYVEVSSNDKDLSEIRIIEIIDDDFCVLNVSDEYGKISDLYDICKYHKELNRDSYLESDNCINKNPRYHIDPNKIGIAFNKDIEEYNLFYFNLSDISDDSQYYGLQSILNKNFNIRWVNNDSLDMK